MINSEEEKIVFSDLMMSILITAFLGMLLSHNLSIYVWGAICGMIISATFLLRPTETVEFIYFRF